MMPASEISIMKKRFIELFLTMDNISYFFEKSNVRLYCKF